MAQPLVAKKDSRPRQTGLNDLENLLSKVAESPEGWDCSVPFAKERFEEMKKFSRYYSERGEFTLLPFWLQWKKKQCLCTSQPRPPFLNSIENDPGNGMNIAWAIDSWVRNSNAAFLQAFTQGFTSSGVRKIVCFSLPPFCSETGLRPLEDVLAVYINIIGLAAAISIWGRRRVHVHFQRSRKITCRNTRNNPHGWLTQTGQTNAAAVSYDEVDELQAILAIENSTIVVGPLPKFPVRQILADLFSYKIIKPRAIIWENIDTNTNNYEELATSSFSVDPITSNIRAMFEQWSVITQATRFGKSSR
ncbi:hypothetical protein BCR34DRAFT_635979 [Clohesyomyces aquaticus]|uniref:Uncharacterized protein n=1 Tax=Clohesyomyces aquaticus TaxID=1231657 RepID=A0A1Y1YWW0_9PLEO|nr:hypothetical protein BCR34DRAFT_635979 [Clohesyomyces aquaticus]